LRLRFTQRIRSRMRVHDWNCCTPSTKMGLLRRKGLAPEQECRFGIIPYLGIKV
jgi:hypothetical protein